MKALLKRLLPPRMVRRMLHLNRLRWLTKLAILRENKVSLADNPRRYLAYVLWDPEVESFSYEIDNAEELSAFVANLLDAPIEQVTSYTAEVDQDPELNGRLRHRMRWRFDTKSKLPAGHRLLWYVLARALKPTLIVETGIYQGLGSLVLLRALERNAMEGNGGELISVDTNPDCGHVVPEELSGRWTRVIGTTQETLETAVDGKRVGMLIQDTSHTYENAAFEFGVAVARGADTLVLLDSGGKVSPALPEACHGRGIIQHFQDRPRNHFYATRGTDVGVIKLAETQVA